MVIIGCGAMNLDLIFKVKDMRSLDLKDIDLIPGREIVLTHQKADSLLRVLQKKAEFLGKSGGGSAANTICALSKLGHECFFISTVGVDEQGEFLINEMKGVDCRFVKKIGRSSMCIIVLDEKNDRSMAVVPGVFEVDFDNLELIRLLRKAGLFHFTSLVQNKGPAIQYALISQCSSNTIISFDPGEVYAKLGYLSLKNLFSATDIFFSTDYELELFFKAASEKEVIKNYLKKRKDSELDVILRFPFFKEYYPPILIKKMGSKGAKVFNRQDSLEIPAQKINHVVDNTGAGDAFNAGVIHAILSKKDVKSSIKIGTKLAAFSLGFPGRQWINHLSLNSNIF